jgi:hypothetical protein
LSSIAGEGVFCISETERDGKQRQDQVVCFEEELQKQNNNPEKLSWV